MRLASSGSQDPGSLQRQLLRLSLPLAGTQLANIALSITDTIVMGYLSVAALAGGGLAVIWFNQIRTMAVGLLTPLGNRIAQVHARYEHNPSTELQQEIRNLTRTGLFLATASGIIGAILLVLISYALPFFGQPSAVTDAAIPMMWALAPGLIPCLWFQVSRQFCVGLGKPQSLLGITLAMVVVNALLNFAFAFGYGPFPELGLVGIGLSTTLVHCTSAAAYFVLINRNPEINSFHAIDFWRRDATSFRSQLLPQLRTQLRLGAPVSATYGAEAGMFSVLALIMGSFGADALAAHNVVYQVTFIVFQIGIGFSHGSSILVSRAFGLHDVHLSRRIGLQALATMMGVVSISAIFFLFTPEFVLRPFMRDATPEALALAVSLLMIGTLMEFVDTGQNVAIGALRGINDTSTGLKASLVGYWVVGLPAALAFAYGFHLGPHGIWWGLVAGLATSAFLLWTTFLRKTQALEET